jgi:hypothetical protein
VTHCRMRGQRPSVSGIAFLPERGLVGGMFRTRGAEMLPDLASLHWPPISPMHPTLVREPFHRPGWVYERKEDGSLAAVI